MGASRDAGLEYLIEIGFNRIRGRYGLADRLIKAFGKAKAEKMWNYWKSLDTRSTEFYEFKNSDPEISRAFIEAYDGDIIRKACNYVFDHKEYFGKTILEVSCDAGYMTGFLAKTFPSSTIIAIDRSKSAIELAKKRTEALGVKNVEFRNCSLMDINENHDTVFCMRTIQENYSYDDAPFFGEPIVAQFLCYADLTEDYTAQLIDRIGPSGYLCIFERVGHNPLMCGWLMEFNAQNCGMLPDSYKEYKCEEAEGKNTFQAFICKPGISAGPEEIIALWYKAMQIDYAGRTTLKGWNALVYLHDNAGQLIRGIRVIDREQNQVGRLAVFRDKDDESTIYYLSAANNGEITLLGCAAEIEDDILKHLKATIDINIRSGNSIEEINPHVDFLEGRSGLQDKT